MFVSGETARDANGTPCSRKGSKSKRRSHLIVKHDYHDHSTDPTPPELSTVRMDEEAASTSVGSPAFPVKLYMMLLSVEEDGHSDVVSWQPHGRCFLVHKPKEFKALLPRYFNKLSKVASFQRQLNLYGFIRLSRGRDKGAYYNELFLRGKPSLCNKIVRVKLKGTGVRAKSNPDEEPDFWGMPWMVPEEDSEPRTHFRNCNPQSSVVSTDDEEETDHPLDLEYPQGDQFVSSPVEPTAQPAEGSLVYRWGMPFRYLPKYPRDKPVIMLQLPFSHLESSSAGSKES